MSGEVDKYIKQTYRYFYEDGLAEITVGLLLAAVGGALLAWRALAVSPVAAAILAVALPLLITGGMSLVRRLVRGAKERVTFERAGYVAYRRGEPAGNRWFLVAPTLLLFVALLFLPEEFNRMQFAVGYLSAVCFCYFGYRLGLRRFYGVGGAALLVGVWTTLVVVDEISGTGFTISGMGLLMVLAGAVALVRFLRKHPGSQGDQL